MSSTEDCELQDLVKQTLEKAGSLSKIRAELRANVFLALEENGCFQGTNSKNQELLNFSQSSDGALVLCLIQEFLECFGLPFTLSVLDPELASYGVRCPSKSRDELMKQLNFPADLDLGKKKPLIHQILQEFLHQRSNVPSPVSQTSKNQKLQTNLRSAKNRSLASATEYSDTSIAAVTGKKNELIHETFDESKERTNMTPSQVSPIAENAEWMESFKSSSTSGKDSLATDLYKLNSSLLGDLPPLSSPTNPSKMSLNATNKSSKQMSKLKAMLIDSSYESTNASNITEDELLNSIDQEDMSGSENIDEKLIRELLKE